MDSTRTPPIDSLNLAKSKVHLQSTPGGLHEEWTGSGGDWRRTGGGLHKDPWGSVRYKYTLRLARAV